MKSVSVTVGYILAIDDYGVVIVKHDPFDRKPSVACFRFPRWVQPGWVSAMLWWPLRFSRPARFVRRLALKLQKIGAWHGRP